MDDWLDAVAAVQEGDYGAVKAMVLARVFGANASDSSHCTLLHWAAINNRVQIASLLIDHGAESLPGGILNETPLQWALRKKYYAMAQLIVDKLHPDLGHRSRDGLDALHLAVRLDDPSAVFLLLTWGAAVDSLDNEGNTPLLWLVKTNEPTANMMEMVRMLLRFGASALVVDTDGNTATHLLAHHRTLDLTLAFLLYQSAGSVVANLTNRAGNTPYAEAVLHENRRLTRFLFDMLFFNYLPYWTPSALSALLVCAGFLLVQYDGYFYGGVYLAALWTALSYWLLQQHVYEHRCRPAIGIFAGTTLALVAVHHVYLAAFLSAGAQLLQASAFCAACLAAQQFISTRPRGPSGESKGALARKVVLSACVEGTDEEHEMALEHADSGSANSPTITKDAFTGKIAVVPAHHDADGLGLPGSGMGGTASGQLRGLGPRLCGMCLADKRAVHAVSVPGGEDASVVSLSTHCPYCNCCVADQDHHCEFLGNCVGQGNRRAFVLFCVGVALACALFVYDLKAVQYSVFCDAEAAKESMWARVRGAEGCLFWTFPALFMAQALAVGLTAVFACLAYNELLFVARETTLLNVLRQRYVAVPPPASRQKANCLAFLRTGEYRVTYPRPEDDLGQRRRRPRRRSSDAPSADAAGAGHDHSHGHCSHSRGAAEERPGEAMDESVRSLLARIESDMGIRSAVVAPPAGAGASAGLAEPRPRSGSVRVAPFATPDRRPSAALAVAGAAAAAVGAGMDRFADVEQGRTRDPPRDEASAAEGDGSEDGGDDEYDAEFVASAHNAYQRFYWQEAGAVEEQASLLRSR